MSDSSTRWFELEPVDAWFFRDGKPSNRGEDQSDLESMFPPHATTVVGALRAGLARNMGWKGRGNWSDEIKEVLGDDFDDLGQLTFTGPLLMRSGELLFPMPRHLLGQVCHEREEPAFSPKAWLVPSGESIPCDGGAWRLPVAPSEAPKTNGSEKLPASAENFFVTAAGLDRILGGAFPEENQCLHRDALFVHEPRVGIARDAETRTTGQNAMYSPGYVRLARDVSLVMGVSGLPGGHRAPSLLPLGGESRLAACTELTGSATPGLPRSQAAGEQGVLILLTPAHFHQDHVAGRDWWGAGPGEPASHLHSGLSGQVLTATVDRPIRIGGWDFRARGNYGGPRPLAPFAPAGGVWWLEQAPAQQSGEPLRLGNEVHSRYGYGLAVAGRVPKNNERS